jgi:KUP system potassium uptake protein
VFSSTFTKGNPSYDDLVQVLSVIIWSLTLMVTVKYVLIVLRADNEGEGGTFSCYSLLTRYVRLVITTRTHGQQLIPDRQISQTVTPENKSSSEWKDISLRTCVPPT